MKKEITSLTPKQEAMIKVYIKRYAKLGFSTKKINRVKAEAAVTAVYKYLKMSKPRFIWAGDPFEGAKIAAQLAKDSKDITKKEFAKQVDNVSFGSLMAGDIAFYAFMSEVVIKEKNPLIEICKQIIKHCGVYWTFEGVVVMAPRPKEMHMKNGKLHNTKGMALKYDNGVGIHAVDGKVCSPKTFVSKVKSFFRLSK